MFAYILNGYVYVYSKLLSLTNINKNILHECESPPQYNNIHKYTPADVGASVGS